MRNPVEIAWLESYLNHDAAVMDRSEADEFRIVYPDGTVVMKAQELAAVKKPHKPRDAEFKISAENVTVRLAPLDASNFRRPSSAYCSISPSIHSGA